MCYLVITASTWAGGAARREEHAKQWESPRLPPHPSLQPLPSRAAKTSIFLGGLILVGISQVYRKKQLPRKLQQPAPGLLQPHWGQVPPLMGPEALRVPWHIPLHKLLHPGSWKDSYNISPSSPEPLFPSKLIGLKTNTTSGGGQKEEGFSSILFQHWCPHFEAVSYNNYFICC